MHAPTAAAPKQPCVAKATIDLAFSKQNQCCCVFQVQADLCQSAEGEPNAGLGQGTSLASIGTNPQSVSAHIVPKYEKMSDLG